MSVADVLWRGAAAVLSRPAVAGWLIRRAKRHPYRAIQLGDLLYMNRWWLFNPYSQSSDVGLRKWAEWLPSVRIHHICRPDADQHLHDHPWDARTVILAGSYIEELPDGSVRGRWTGETGVLRFGEFHRIAQVSPGGAWTLFITYRYRGTWGFSVDGRKVPWRAYLGLPQ